MTGVLCTVYGAQVYFYFSSEPAEQNSKKLGRKQDFKVLYQVLCFLCWSKNKMAALASDLLRHFRLLLWNCWTEFNESWQEARFQLSLPSLSFSGRSEKQDGRPGLWLAETFSTSPLKLLNEIQRNLKVCKISTSSTKFVFFGPLRKTRWPPWPLVCWDVFDFSSETTERNSMKFDKKQDLNVLYHVCVFPGDQNNKMAALASDLLRDFWLLLWNCWTEFNESWQEARFQLSLPSLFFFRADWKNKMAALASDWLRHFLTSPLNPLNRIQRNLVGSKISRSSTKFCVFCADRKNKMAVLASDLLRHFRLLLWNCWTEFNESWQEARFQLSLPSLSFSGRSEKQDGRPGLWLAETFFDFSSEPAEQNSKKLGRKQDFKVLYQVLCFLCWSEKQDGRSGLWLAETFSTFPLKPLNGIQRNLTGSKISTSSTNYIFFGPIGKQKLWQIVLRCTICGSLGLLFCLFVCLSVVNLGYDFWPVRDRDFIFGMHTPLMMAFHMIPRSMTLTFVLKIASLELVATGGILFHIHMYFCLQSKTSGYPLFNFLNTCFN